METKNNFTCAYCNKIYIRKTSYNNHMLTCKLARYSCNISNNENTNLTDIDSFKTNDININNLFSMVIMLHNKYEKLESEYAELKKYVNITKNKINILDYLNENFKNEFINSDNNINKFINDIIIDETMLDIVFKYDYVDGIINILTHYIEKFKKSGSLIPIKCFNNKENILYIFDNDSWIIMDDVNLQTFVKSFDKKLLLQFLNWKIQAEKSLDSEVFGEIYIKNMKKVIAGNFEKKNKFVMIKNKLYKYLKADLKSIVQYEFV